MVDTQAILRYDSCLCLCAWLLEHVQRSGAYRVKNTIASLWKECDYSKDVAFTIPVLVCTKYIVHNLKRHESTSVLNEALRDPFLT